MRLFSLDVFRGITIAAMIIVNNPGSWQNVYPLLLHAEWNGCAPADLIFPFFLFILGSAMAFSIANPGEKRQKYYPGVYRRIFQRTAALLALGMLLNIFPHLLDCLLNSSLFDAGSIRLTGVLQRIGLAYFLASLAVVNVPFGRLWIIVIGTLAGYWLAIIIIPVPGFGSGLMLQESNLLFYIDRILLTPSHMYKNGAFDPEGLLSTIPSTITVLSGYLFGKWIRTQPVKSVTSIMALLSGLACLLAGSFWGIAFPINKSMWTSSYVVFTSGWALLFMAACYEAIEVRGWRSLLRPFEIMGRNSIFLYVASGLTARAMLTIRFGSGADTINIYTWLYKNLFVPWAGTLNGSLVFALFFLFFWWIILYGMYRRRWFVKV
jgi:predicted acyltransferase